MLPCMANTGDLENLRNMGNFFKYLQQEIEMILQVTGLTCKLEWQDAHPFIDVTQALDSGTSRLGMGGSQWGISPVQLATVVHRYD